MVFHLKSQVAKALHNRIPHAYCEEKRLSNAINSLGGWLPANSLCPAVALFVADVLPPIHQDFFPHCSPALDSPALPRRSEDTSQSVKAEEEFSIGVVHGYDKSMMEMRFLYSKGKPTTLKYVCAHQSC